MPVSHRPFAAAPCHDRGSNTMQSTSHTNPTSAEWHGQSESAIQGIIEDVEISQRFGSERLIILFIQRAR
jgi:hypothetical protein